MGNKETFAEFAIIILKGLFDSFPIAINLNKEEHLGNAILYPNHPFKSHSGGSETGIYVGPEFIWEWSSSNEEDREKYWKSFDWGQCEKDTEALLERELTDEEKGYFLLHGVRPYTTSESEQLAEWKAQVETYQENREQQKIKEDIYLGTIQFLVNEGFIRIIDIPEKANMTKQPPDVLIQQAFKLIRFMLTNKGFIHMHRKPPMGKGNLYGSMKEYLADKTVDAFAGAGAGSLLTVFLS